MTTVSLAGAGLHQVPLTATPLNRKDFASGQEVRWCPGCGDYSILASFPGLMPPRSPWRPSRTGGWRSCSR